MPKNNKHSKKGQKSQQQQQTEKPTPSKIACEILKGNFDSNLISFFEGILEEQENINEIMISTDKFKEIMLENLVEQEGNKNELQLVEKLSQEIVTKYCMTYDQEQSKTALTLEQEQQEEEEQKKEASQDINTLKKQFGDLVEDFDNMIWDEQTIKEYEQIKEQEKIAMKYGCVLCERIIPLTFHHLIPRTTHSRTYNKGKTYQELNKGIWICRQCHSGIHNLIDEETMAQSYYTYNLLLEHEGVIKLAKYLSKQKPSFKQDQRLFDNPSSYIRDNKRDKL